MGTVVQEKMIEYEYKFTTNPERRERAFFHVFLIGYPVLIVKFLFGRKPSGDTVFYVIFFPLLAIRQLFTGLAAHCLFRVDIDYHLILYDTHLAFGPAGDKDKLMANSYASIRYIFNSYGCWNLLLHDGWFVHLHPGDEGEVALEFIRKKQESAQHSHSS